MRLTRPQIALLLAAALAGVGVARLLRSSRELPESAHAPPLDPVPRVDVAPSEWLTAHFASPIPPQGDPPAWTPIELGLDAASCGACHVQQYLDWKESWHAGAMGPGVMGQLLDPSVANESQCRRCHAPLAEQAVGTDLASDAISCAACHVRSYERSGPPKDHPMEDAPHGGFVARPEFTESSFCASCHDFGPTGRILEGKLLQETTQEWARTSYAEQGVTCQGCHMPDGRHLWKGVHDPDMVRRALSASLTVARAGDRLSGALAVTNVGAGHRMPTYTTPQLTLRVEQRDASGAAIPGTAREGAIARRLTPDLKEELFDTRLLPGERHDLAYDVPVATGARTLHAEVTCSPDEAYVRFYTIKLKDPTWAPNGRAQIQEALTRAESSRFVVWEEDRPIP